MFYNEQNHNNSSQSMNIETIAASVIGSDQTIQTPFGEKPLVYADYTASGRCLGFIEDYIRDHVMPAYANTHTEFSYTGAQSTLFREQSRSIIHKAVNGSDDDKVIFCGSGATAAIDKLMGILGIRIPSELAEKITSESLVAEEQRPVIFVGPYEHHSNELPWRESIGIVVSIPENDKGQIDCHILEQKLQEYGHHSVKIGSFSAASNVTGIRSDVTKITRILKQYNALSFWDYAAAAPYLKIDMNGEAAIDAVFFSPHKFVGGPGTPGVLIIKQHIMNNAVPAMVGGGTVSFVTPESHEYVTNPVVREEGGTPAIIESIRAGLVVKLQQDVGVERIEALEEQMVKRTIEFLNTLDNVEILGNPELDRISIFSLRFKHGERDLHHGFVTALFNDLFGIQMRGGCSCAGPYGHYLLGIDMSHSNQLSQLVKKGYGCFKPGWVRFNLNYFLCEDELNYIYQAIKLIAKYGYLLLPYYQLDQASGIWRYQGQVRDYSCSLADIDFDTQPEKVTKERSKSLTDYLTQGLHDLKNVKHEWQQYDCCFPSEVEELRWFATA